VPVPVPVPAAAATYGDEPPPGAGEAAGVGGEPQQSFRGHRGDHGREYRVDLQHPGEPSDALSDRFGRAEAPAVEAPRVGHSDPQPIG
jgi:hypothetical protein